MTRIEALEELAAKVEAGGANQNTFLKYGHNLPMLASMWEAYRGSLDAAKAIMEAVLPGWVVERMSIWPGASRVYLWGTHQEDGEVWHHPKDGRAAAKSDNPARAWLLAILRALTAQEKAK